MSSQRGARSKLADVLADIKNSREDDEYEYNNHDATPIAPTKTRRSAINYALLSGHSYRQPKSNAATNSNSTASQNDINNQESKISSSAATTPNIKTNGSLSNSTLNHTAPRPKTCILKLFDRSVDLAPFCNTKSEVPLYPVCRAWIHGLKTNQANDETTILSASKKPPKTVIDKPSSSPIPKDNNCVEGINEIFDLPPALPKRDAIKRFKLDTEDEDVDLRIPLCVRRFKPPEGLEATFDQTIDTMDQRDCLELNKQRWKRVKKDWSEARKVHEWRYQESFKILEF